MAKKKVATKKKTTTTKTTTEKTENKLQFTFKEITKEMSNKEKLAVHQHNAGQLYSFQMTLAGNVKLDSKDSEIASAVNKMLLIDRKLLLIGSEINKLVQIVEDEEKSKTESSKSEITM